MDAQQFTQLLEVFSKTQETLIAQLQEQRQAPAPVSNILLPPFENFDEKKENFDIYRKRFENYLAMKGVLDNKPLASRILINSIGATHFKLLMSLAAPQQPEQLTYDQIIEKLQKHLCPKKNLLVVQHQFLSTYQEESQSIADYLALLKRDINDCEFYATCPCRTNVADLFLRAQFIRGLSDNYVREQILQAEALDFAQIVQKALILESSRKDSQILGSKFPKEGTSTSDTNKIFKKPARRESTRQKPIAVLQ